MNGRETPYAGICDALWLAVGAAVTREADETQYVGDLAATAESR